MAGSMRLSLIINADGTAAIQGINRVRGGVGDLDREADRAAKGGLTAVTNQLKSLAMTAAAGIGVAELARAFITAATESQRFQASLTAITGSTQAAGAEMEYIRATADKMGLKLGDVATAWISLSAAAKGSALEGQAARDIFESVFLAMGKLGKSSADTQGALLAIEQMISKGVVSAEELRGQLGERLPGAFKAAADAMGRTEQELGKMLESGEVMAEDLLPLLSQRLNELYNDGKEIGGLAPEWNRLTNALSDMAVEADRATSATNLLADALRQAKSLADVFGQAFTAIQNARAGLGLQNFASDADKFNATMGVMLEKQREFQMLSARVAANQDSLFLGQYEAQLRRAGDELGVWTQKVAAMQSAQVAAAKSARDLANQQAATVGDDMVKRWEEHKAAVDESRAAVDKIVASYDKKKDIEIKVKEKQKELTEAVKFHVVTEERAKEILKEFTADLEKSTTAKGGAAKAANEAAKATKDYEKDLADLVKQFLPARADAVKLAEATELIAKAHAKGDLVGKDYAEMVKKVGEAYDTATNDAQKLIDKYDTEGAKARELAQDRAELTRILADGTLKVEGAQQAMEKLTKAEKENGKEADAWTEVWKNAVKRIDDTFASLWKDLFSGTKTTLESLKGAISSWLAEVAHTLLTKPLVVAITAGGSGVASAAGTAASAASGASGLGSIFSSFSNLASGVTSLFSGATAAGITAGWGTAMAEIGAMGYGGAFGTIMGQAGSLAATGNFAASMAAAAPYLLPAIAAIAAIAALGGAFTGDGYDHEPGYWGVSTGGSGVDNRFRGGRGVSGGFGLSFGVDAASTDEFDWDMWPEYEKMMAAMADMSQQLATFYGEDVAKAVEKALSDASGEGLLLLTHEFSSSFVYAFDRIIAEAAKTGDDLAVVMEDVFSGIVDYTSMDTYATSIQEAMVIAQTALAMADDLAGTAMGDALDLTGEVVADAKRLADYGLLVREEGEGAAEAFVRMAMQLALLDQAVQQTATDLSDLTAEGVLELSTALVDAFGSLDAATQAQAFYYDQFTTQTEKLVDAIQAAAKTINREIPKLQDELIKLSEDIVQEVKKIADDLDAGLEDLSGALEDTGNFWVDTQRRLADEWAKGIAANAAAIADGSASAATQAVTTWQLWQIVEEGLGNYGDALRDLGYDVDNGAEAFIESLNRVRDAIKDPLSPEGDGATPDTITIPGDPNAAILAKLLDDLPKTREGFNELIGGLKLTDEASRKLYAGLMELLPQFDLLYDGVEAFTDWLLGVDEVGQATRELERVFKDWGLTLPENRDALKDLYDSGILTTEQMAILGAYLKELGLVFGDLKDDVDGINELDLSKLRDAYAVLEQAARAEREAVEAQYRARMEAIAAEREALDAQHQARLAAIASEREAVNAAYQARMDSIAAQRESAAAANKAQLDALAKQREAAQEALSVAEAGLSRIQSALDAFRGDAPRNEMERMRALRQLGAWARAGTLPGEEQLDRAITGATNLNAEDFGTEAAYRAAQGSAYSALLALEKVGVRQVSDAERQIAAIETASDRAAAAYEAQLAAIDAQAEQAAGQRDAALEILARQEESATAWRDQELARLEAETEAAQTWRDENLAAIDDLLELAAKQIAILEGTYVETKSLAEAINDLNDALIDAGGEPLAPTQADLAALLPPMGDIAAAANATTTEVIALRQEIVVLRQDLASVATAQVVPLKAIDERLRKWDLDGMPSSAEATGTETALRAA